ncbi:MAG TPA: class I adenylate-forming enzyme family protein [Gaiellaceae bacterium]|nr:class I adenylate-forming enzyme family protein [Gaiellaceae bacterium]
MTRSVREIDELLSAAGERFEMETVEIRGRLTRAWKHAPSTLGDLLDRGAAIGGERDFLVLDDERLSHREHRDRALRLANALVDELGVRPGDRVAIAMRNVTEWSIAFFAAAYAGAVAVALNAFWNGAELAFGIGDATPAVLIADGERFERLVDHPDVFDGVPLVGTRLDDRKTDAPLPDGIIAMASLLERPASLPDVEVGPDDLATILYTSGTTSHPKGVLGTHRNICSNVLSMEFVTARGMMRAGLEPPLPPMPPAITLMPVPLFHATGLHSNLAAQGWFGGTLVLMRRWDPEAALDLIEQERVTGVSGVPTMAWELVNSPTTPTRDLSSLRSLAGGGAAAPPELIKRIDAVLPSTGTGTGYGMTETSSLAASIGGADYQERPTSVGVPVPVLDVRIVNAEGRDVAPGEVGEIWMAGVTVVPGYWNRPEATEETFGGGWLRSGDLGRIDDEGFLYIVDRAKDMVIRGGENISSLEVEAALFDHPAVVEAAVFAVPHDVLGEEVGAVVRMADGATATPAELRAHVAAQLAPFKVPAHLWLTDEPFPKGPTGKTQKRELKAAYTQPAH